MENLLIAIVLFIVLTFLIWRFTNRPLKRKYGAKTWNHWTTRTYYWQAAVYFSTAFTFAIMYALKWGSVLTF